MGSLRLAQLLLVNFHVFSLAVLHSFSFLSLTALRFPYMGITLKLKVLAMSCGKVLLKVDIVRVEYDSKIPSPKTIRAPYNHDMRL